MTDSTQRESGLVGILHRAGRVLLRLKLPWSLVPPALWVLLIWLASEFAGAPAGARGLFFKVLGNGMHAFEFGILTLLALPLARRQALAEGGHIGNWVCLARPQALGILAFALVCAVTDEVHQIWVPGRVGSAFDVLTDVTGAGCVLWIASYLAREDADEAGLRRRLGLGILACTAAACISTLSDRMAG
ncbi:MAG: hypothetical protein ACI8QC_002862 [Planctomycetota bacterium]|jgi:hypothetical protein